MSDTPNGIDSDQASFAEASAIRVNQSAGLVNCARTLARYAAESDRPEDASCFALASILVAAAAVEANLAEFGVLKYGLAPPAKFFRLPNSEKYEKLIELKTAQDPQQVIEKMRPKPEPSEKPKPNFEIDHPDVAELIAHRNAITHSEPDNPRSISYGVRLNPAGARWAAEIARSFADAIWGDKMPDGMKNDLRQGEAIPPATA